MLKGRKCRLTARASECVTRSEEWTENRNDGKGKGSMEH